jgi:RAP domain
MARLDDGCCGTLLAMGCHSHKLSVVTQVDGPHHFTANTHTPLGETAGRCRLLAARGWTVISVPYFLWDTSPSLPAKQAALAQVVSFVS